MSFVGRFAAAEQPRHGWNVPACRQWKAPQGIGDDGLRGLTNRLPVYPRLIPDTSAGARDGAKARGLATWGHDAGPS